MIELQALLRRIEHLLEIRQMEQNRFNTPDPVIIESIKTLLTLLDEQLESTRKQIRQLIDQDPVTEASSQITGIHSSRGFSIYRSFIARTQ